MTTHEREALIVLIRRNMDNLLEEAERWGDEGGGLTSPVIDTCNHVKGIIQQLFGEEL